MKRAFSCALAVLIAFGMTYTVNAAASGKITEVIAPISDRDYNDVEVSPGKVYEFPLTTDMFEWSEGSGSSSEAVTESMLSKGKVAVKVKYNKNKSKDYVETVEIGYKKFSKTGNKKTAYVKVEFANVKDTKEHEFDFTVYLTVNGKRQSVSEIEFTGELARGTVEVYADEDTEYVDLSDGSMAEADGYIRNIEFYLGKGVYVRTKMYEDKKYYGTAESKITEEDTPVLDAYPEIVEIVRLNTNITSGTIFFEVDDTYYLYNEDGHFIGTTDDEDVKFSTTYYLATEKVKTTNSSNNTNNSKDDDDDVYYADEDDEVYYVPDDDFEDLDDMDTVYDPNDNPGTGAAKGIAGALVLAGVASVAIVFTSHQKKRRSRR